MIATIALALLITYLTIIITGVLVRNYKAHKFYETKSPHLPVLPNPNILAGHALSILTSDKNWKIIEDLHEKYGPTFGFYMMEQPWVATKDLDLIKLVEIDEAHKHVNRPAMGLPFTEYNNSIWHNEDDHWRQVRRIIAPALTNSNRKIRGDVVSLDIESVVGQLAESLERRAKKANDATGGKSDSFVIEARDISERFTLAVIFLTTYKQANVIDFDAEQDAWVRHVTLAAHEISNPIVYLSMAVPPLRSFCEWINQFSYTGQMQKRIVTFIEQATDLNKVAREQHERTQQKLGTNGGESFSDVKSQGVFRRRLVDTIIDSLFEKKIRYDNFVASLYFLLLAGFMTTADTITCLLWQLARNQDVQDKLRRVILEEGIDADYVLWCINETVRFHPAVPLATGRVLGADVTVNGQFLAKGSFIMPTTHGIHHDPKIWPEPERFNPERWRDQANFHPAQFVGFGLGPRNCVGGKLAVYEIKLVTKMILSTYKLETCETTPEEWHFSSGGLVFTLNDQAINIKFAALNKQEATAPAAY